MQFKLKNIFSIISLIIPILILLFIIPIINQKNIPLIQSTNALSKTPKINLPPSSNINKINKPTISNIRLMTPTITPSPTATQTPKPTPTTLTQKNFQFGIIVPDYTNPNGELKSLNTLLNNQIKSVTIYKQFGLYPDLHEEDLAYLKSQNFHLIITWEPWNPEQGMSQSQDYLSQIPTGQLDGYLKKFAQSVKSYGKPITIRFAHEMNGDWYPWASRPTQYIAAYRYIVNLFKSEAVTNVTWQWSVNSDNVPYTTPDNVSKYYPGNEYVNTIGIDGYNFGNSNWRSFDNIFSPMYSYLTKTYNKPIEISETASSEIGGDKSVWVNDMFTNIRSNKYYQVTRLTWFSLLKEADWRINSSINTQNAFKNNLR